jgi:hypothetical protein
LCKLANQNPRSQYPNQQTQPEQSFTLPTY